MRRIQLLLFFCLFLSALFTISLYSQPTKAQSSDFAGSQCADPTMPYYDALAEVEQNQYDVFVKLGKRGQTATTTLNIENEANTRCDLVGTIVASGDTWQKIGSYSSVNSTALRFQLLSDIFNTEADANRPEILLVPQKDPPCTPSFNCSFTYHGQPAYIVPTSTLLSEDSLRVMQVRPIDDGTIQQVDYYSDGQLLYTAKNLEPFNLSYVNGGNHTLSRVVVYASGQKVVIPSSVYVSFAQDFQNLLFRTFNGNRGGIQVLAVITLLIFAGVIGLLVIHTLHRRHVWKVSHGVAQTEIIHPEGLKPETEVPPPHYLSEDSRLIHTVKHLMPFAVIVLIALATIGLVDTYAAQLFRVDGVSMESTLKTNDLLFVNKLPKTWASLNKQEYVPKRGEIVVFHKAHSDLFLSENNDETNIYVVKRVIGLPGERIIIQNGVVTVYNAEHPDGFKPDQDSEWAKSLTINPTESIDVTLAQSEIFVAGDNRPQSLDSRTNGPINVSDIVGRAEARVLPFGSRRSL